MDSTLVSHRLSIMRGCAGESCETRPAIIQPTGPQAPLTQQAELRRLYSGLGTSRHIKSNEWLLSVCGTHQTGHRTHLGQRRGITDGLRDEHGSDLETCCKVTTEFVGITILAKMTGHAMAIGQECPHRKSVIWKPIQRGYVVLPLGPGRRCRRWGVDIGLEVRIWSPGNKDNKFMGYVTYVQYCIRTRHTRSHWDAIMVCVHRPHVMGGCRGEEIRLALGGAEIEHFGLSLEENVRGDSMGKDVTIGLTNGLMSTR